MLTVEEALEKILGYVHVLEPETKPIMETLGQVIAEDVYSDVTVPPLDNSAMDGYAVRSQDTIGASERSPRVLKVIDTVSAGSMSKLEVRPGTAIRVMTGAPVPAGADAVVKFEDTDEEARKKTLPAGERPGEIGILAESRRGDNIRLAGEDIAKGMLVLSKGKVVRPSEVGVLASVGRTTAQVIRRPVVAVLATGNELVNPGQPLPPAKIYDSNSYTTAASVARYGGIPRLLGVALDTESSLVGGLRRGLDADMLITTGGVSAGDYDMVKDVLSTQGEMTFWRVRMKPGKPIAFGMIRGRDKNGVFKNIPHLGLPGNPVSVMITFELFARPAILKMLGKKNWTKPVIEAVIEEDVSNSDGRRVFARAIVDKKDGYYSARLTGPQGSGILTSMSLANGLVVIPEEKQKVRKGDTVKVIMMDWDEEQR
ncbi:MAG: molybdopterin molybdotransferase MoeA [Chloroflexi bacterium]|nr:molybdopterin molybdotransferase MoeA [Chloroflexota bacterium]